MRVPNTEGKLIDFAKEQIETCTYSQSDRGGSAATNLAYYENGAAGSTESLYNRTGIHIDRSASYLYAPGEVRYSIAFDATEGDPWLARARAASKYLSREYRRADADIVFSHCVKYALIKGCMIVKHNWHTKSLDAHMVHPEFFGVEREDLMGLHEQQAMVHTYYLPMNQVLGLVHDEKDKSSLKKKIKRLSGSAADGVKQNWLHQVVVGGVNPIAASTATGATAQVAVAPSSQVNFSPMMMNEFLRIDELWVVDDEREDYTTIQLVEGEVLIEGKYRHRNLTGVEGMHPFSKVCADPVAGYFWGRAEVERVKMLQDMLTERMTDVRRLLKLQVKPPKAFIGFSGLTSQKMRAALAPGGFIQEQSPGAKIENLIPNIPEAAFAEIQTIAEMFDEIGGFKPILQGQGEPGVRANAHARTLMRTASPKLRERALTIERDAEESAHIVFRLMQAKEARVFVGEKKEQFLLKQMPGDYYVEIDSHTSSPAFVDDARELAFAMKKLGAIDDEGLIMMVHPPMEDQLIASSRARSAARAALIKQNPELLTKGKAKI